LDATPAIEDAFRLAGYAFSYVSFALPALLGHAKSIKLERCWVRRACVNIMCECSLHSKTPMLLTLVVKLRPLTRLHLGRRLLTLALFTVIVRGRHSTCS
jgi:hypothetical protein